MATNSAPQYAEDELVPPAWLDGEFFNKILHLNVSQFKLKRCNIRPATNKGEHFASIMFRIHLEYDNAGTSMQRMLIVKTIPADGSQKRQILQESKLFETEMVMYTQAVPQLEDLLRDVGCATQLGATCLYHAMQPEKVLAFEDLSVLGYEIVRARPLTITEIEVGYQKLSKWHAASYKLNKKKPEALSKYTHSFMTMPFIAESSFIADGLVNFIEMLGNTPTLKQYQTYFASLQPGWTENCIASYAAPKTEPNHPLYMGLCHGDFLCNNLMFKHNATTAVPEDVLLVDFQLCYLGPLVNDLIYAFYMLYDATQRAELRDALLKYYFQEFVHTLRSFGDESDVIDLNYKQLEQQMKQQKYLDFCLLVNFLPIRYAIKAGLVERDYMQATLAERRPLYYDPDYIKEVHSLLDMYSRLGYFK